MPLIRRASAAVMCALAGRFRRWLIAVLFVVCAGSDASAQGQCSVQSTAAPSFGSGTSFVVQATAQSAVAAAVASCTGSLFNLDSPSFRATVDGSVNNFRLSNGVGDFVTYNVFADPGYSFPIMPGVPFEYYQPAVLSAIGHSGTTGSLPMHFRTVPGGNLAAGTYTDTFTINWAWRICNARLLFVCLGHAQGTATTAVTLTLTVTSACQITSTPNVQFGSAPTPQMFASVDQSIGVLCTKNTMTHSVGLSAGQNSSGGRRQMANGANVLQYDIFVGSSTSVWGAVGAGRVAAPGPANGVTSQLFPYRARVYPVQPNPPVGIYSDLIIVDIVF